MEEVKDKKETVENIVNKILSERFLEDIGDREPEFMLNTLIKLTKEIVTIEDFNIRVTVNNKIVDKFVY